MSDLKCFSYTYNDIYRGITFGVHAAENEDAVREYVIQKIKSKRGNYYLPDKNDIQVERL